ncbi:hypothetical protein E4U55_000505 [Claviceps digitariae]|nr:hypothetical protein E4U55_000505 [Claviceps digitariae]
MQFLSVLVLSVAGFSMAKPVPENNAAKPEVAQQPNADPAVPGGFCLIFDDCYNRNCCDIVNTLWGVSHM